MRQAFVVALVLVMPSCGGSVQAADSKDPSPQAPQGLVACTTLPAGGGGGEAIGAPCVTDAEQSSTFPGFSSMEVSFQSSTNDTSGAPGCLVYHFQGRVSCPYGQSADGSAPPGASPCVTPMGHPVEGAVLAQCADRPASQTVVWSCRCANANGLTNDGANYCTCPCGTECTSAISSVGAPTSPSQDISGSYCIPSGVTAVAECSALCDPATAPCP